MGVIQSSYVPWRGYFDFIRTVDLFVLYDDTQYSPGSWRNRNLVKTAGGVKWLSVPVKKKLGLAIDETRIEHAHPWREQNRGLLYASFHKAPYRDDALSLWDAGTRSPCETISELNVQLIRLICDYLGIRTPLELSRQYQLTGTKTERLVHLLTRVGASTYVSGPTARGYLEESRFRDHRIRLEYKSYDYAPYPQTFGPFEGAVSVLDLIANVGREAPHYLESRTPNEVAVS